MSVFYDSFTVVCFNLGVLSSRVGWPWNVHQRSTDEGILLLRTSLEADLSISKGSLVCTFNITMPGTLQLLFSLFLCRVGLRNWVGRGQRKGSSGSVVEFSVTGLRVSRSFQPRPQHSSHREGSSVRSPPMQALRMLWRRCNTESILHDNWQ